ncbi:hypothetical protein Y032_0843g2642 [Ancylostoma ceylanicum]|nr:hypothetical protein Y032_0843g2642 [Ancylostoma ceylanicum]
MFANMFLVEIVEVERILTKFPNFEFLTSSSPYSAEMRTAFGILIALAFVNASWNLFKKTSTTPNPAEYCKDKNETYCAIKVPKGFCESAFHTKDEIKERCAKSCNLCCGDKDPEKCKELKAKGFCESAFHTKTEVKERCGITCGLCDKEEGSTYYYEKVTTRPRRL